MALVLITGAVRSGKSAVAQRLAEERAARGHDVVVAVFGSDADDVEMAARIERHRAERPAALRTLEAADSRSWRDEVPDDAVLLVECLGTLAGRVLDEMVRATCPEPTSRELEAGLDTALSETIAWLARRRGDTVVVSNEVGWGVVPAHASGRVFRDALGRANAALARVADAAYLVVNGRVVDLTALAADVSWPED